jgi:hypothetical protein
VIPCATPEEAVNRAVHDAQTAREV